MYAVLSHIRAAGTIALLVLGPDGEIPGFVGSEYHAGVKVLVSGNPRKLLAHAGREIHHAHQGGRGGGLRCPA